MLQPVGDYSPQNQDVSPSRCGHDISTSTGAPMTGTWNTPRHTWEHPTTGPVQDGRSKPIPRWDVHFGGLEDYRKDSTAPHITLRPQLGDHRHCGLAICTFHLGFSLAPIHRWTALGAPCSGVGLLSQNHHPRFMGAPSSFFKGCPQGPPSVDSGLASVARLRQAFEAAWEQQ